MAKTTRMTSNIIPKIRSYIFGQKIEAEKKVVKISDYSQHLELGVKKKYALLSYLPEPVQASLEGMVTNQFSNDGLGIAWATVLNKLGYIVDIISWNDTEFVPERSYDLFVGHGGKNFEIIHKQLSNKVKSIYFSTGSYWEYHNLQEVRRFHSFKLKHGIDLKYDRYIQESEEYANRMASGIICLGNLDCKNTYKKFSQVYSLNIGCFPDHNQRLDSDIGTQELRKKLLFLSGGGNIHKGLDIVLDTFAENKQYNLFIATELDKDFEHYYHKILKLPNVHSYGFVPMRSKLYYSILDKCSYLVFPSCSEGSPGSVVESMQRNILPIVSKESHIDVNGFGVKLKKSTTIDLKSAISEVTNYSEETFIKKSKLAARMARTRHSPENFELQLANAIKKIIR